MALTVDDQMDYLSENDDIFRFRIDLIDAIEQELNAIEDNSYENQYHQIMASATDRINNLGTYSIEFTVEFILGFYHEMKKAFCIIQHTLMHEGVDKASLDPKDWYLYKDFRKLKYML